MRIWGVVMTDIEMFKMSLILLLPVYVALIIPILAAIVYIISTSGLIIHVLIHAIHRLGVMIHCKRR